MSGDALRKVKTGDPLRIPAGAYNAFVDAAVDHRRRQHDESREPQRLRRDNDVILVLNSTPVACRKYRANATTRLSYLDFLTASNAFQGLERENKKQQEAKPEAV